MGNHQRHYVSTTKKVLGMKNGNSKEWLTQPTWKTIDERREIKTRYNKIITPPSIPSEGFLQKSSVSD